MEELREEYVMGIMSNCQSCLDPISGERVVDSLHLARQIYPGQANSLDASDMALIGKRERGLGLLSLSLSAFPSIAPSVVGCHNDSETLSFHLCLRSSSVQIL